LPNYGDGTRIPAPSFPSDLIAVDTETTGLDHWRGARAFAIILLDTKGRSLYVRLEEDQSDLLLDQLISSRRVPDVPGEGQGPLWQAVSAADWRIEGDLPCPEGSWTLLKVQELIESDRPKVFHNAKFDLRMLFWTFGWVVGGEIHDTMLLARLMLPSKRTLRLKILSDEVLDMPPTEESVIADWMKSNRRYYKSEMGRLPLYIDVPDELMKPYAIGDVKRTMLLLRRWWRSAHDKRWELYRNEIELMFVIMGMEDIGMGLDVEYTTNMLIDTERRVAKLDESIWHIVGRQFNIDSPQQLADALLSDDGLGLRAAVPVDVFNDHSRVMFTKTGALSTARDALKVYKDYDEYQVCQPLMLRGMLSGMVSYYKQFLEQRYENSKGNAVLRPSILQFTAVTGRFSIVEPALQTIPSRSSGRLLDFERDEIPDVRRSFIPPYRTWGMYAFDYSQVELRLIAYYANEEAMIKAFANGEDVHDMTTHIVWTGRETLDDPVVWKRCRTFCKMVNFGIAYGMQEDKFHQELNTPMDVVRATMQIYNEKFPGISNLMEVVKDHVRRYGYLHTVFGRLQLPGRSAAYRGVNYLVQGTGADILKYAMVRIRRWSIENGVPLIILLTIHDEVIIQIHPKYDNIETLRAIAAVLEDFQEFDPLPIRVTCKRIKTNWSDTEGVDLAS
jgi:DNA polymerase-1